MHNKKKYSTVEPEDTISKYAKTYDTSTSTNRSGKKRKTIDTKYY